MTNSNQPDPKVMLMTSSGNVALCRFVLGRVGDELRVAVVTEWQNPESAEDLAECQVVVDVILEQMIGRPPDEAHYSEMTKPQAKAAADHFVGRPGQN